MQFLYRKISFVDKTEFFSIENYMTIVRKTSFLTVALILSQLLLNNFV